MYTNTPTSHCEARTTEPRPTGQSDGTGVAAQSATGAVCLKHTRARACPLERGGDRYRREDGRPFSSCPVQRPTSRWPAFPPFKFSPSLSVLTQPRRT